MQRRTILRGAALAGVAGAAGLAMTAKAAEKTVAPSLTGPYLDLTTTYGNLIASVRLEGNLDESKEKFGSGSGIVTAIRPGEALRDLFGFEIYSTGRMRKQEDGSYRFLHRECIFYTDLKSGEILREFDNPFTNEHVKVVDVANDPWNEHLTEYRKSGGPSYGGQNPDADKGKGEPNLRNWTSMPNGIVATQTHVNLYYPSALTPEKWPRESSGPRNQVSEFQQTYVSLADLQNPALTSVESHGTWSRITPWLPWMLMGQAPGVIMYNSITSNYDDINRTKRSVLDHVAQYHPHMMHAPTEWSDVSQSSLEHYVLEQKPAPLKGN
jgi:hypothetical protein